MLSYNYSVKHGNKIHSRIPDNNTQKILDMASKFWASFTDDNLTIDITMQTSLKARYRAGNMVACAYPVLNKVKIFSHSNTDTLQNLAHELGHVIFYRLGIVFDNDYNEELECDLFAEYCTEQKLTYFSLTAFKDSHNLETLQNKGLDFILSNTTYTDIDDTIVYKYINNGTEDIDINLNVYTMPKLQKTETGYRFNVEGFTVILTKHNNSWLIRLSGNDKLYRFSTKEYAIRYTVENIQKLWLKG